MKISENPKELHWFHLFLSSSSKCAMPAGLGPMKKEPLMTFDALERKRTHVHSPPNWVCSHHSQVLNVLNQ
jgi:hypothetical protein